MKNWIKNITLLTLLAIAGISRAQTYPVQSTVVLTPPYSSYLPDYSDPLNNQMRILLTLTDFSIPSYDVKLRFSITGPNNSFSMVSVDPINLPIITLTPGIPTEISGSDLSVYLNPDNLIFQGLDKNDYIQNQLIPEGLTQICVEVIDPNSVNGTVIGNPACGQNWFSKLNPPQLMSPNCGASLTPFDPQAILFNWTPANFTTNGQTEFVFELYHMIPDQYDGSLPDPNLWVSQANPIFSDSNIFVPVYNYGIGSFPTPMILQLGESYCWRVKAKDPSGRAYYHNNGWSTVCTFTYGSVEEALLDGIELDLNSNGTGKRQGTAWWNVSGTLDSYILELRKTGNSSYEWFPYPTTEGDLKLNSLEPETEYECRVKGLLGDIETDYSNVSTFTTLPPAEYACGETTLPAVSPNVVPLNFLQQGMFVSVGQFEMEVMAAEPDGAAGHFKGYGKIQIPFMLLALNVEFEDLFIDENMTVVDGQVDAITQGVEAWVESFNKEFITGTISSIDFEEGDSIVTVYLADGTAHTYDMPNNGPLVFEDETGLIWTVNPDGTITVTGDLNWDDEVLEATAGHQIYFKAHEDQLFGFDDYRYTLWSEQYPVIKLLDNSMYFVPWKSVGESYEDKIYAVVVDSSGNAINNPTFVDQDGTVFPASSVGNKTWEVTIPAGLPINKKVLAYDDEGKKVGKFNLLKYASREVDVVVVPINNATIPANLQSEVNDIFSQAYTVFSFSEQPNWDFTFDVDSDGLDCSNPDGMELYSAEMKDIRKKYFEAFDTATTEAHYIFVVPGFENASQQGYNVGGKSMSFIKSGVSTRVYAHELGHGTNLEHTFPILPKGTTNNLMDYVEHPDSVHLTALQWEAIQDYHLLFSFLDNEEDGSMITLNTNSFSEIFQLSNPDGSITFMGLAGIPITLKGTISQLKFITYEDKWRNDGQIVDDSYAPMGGLVSFKIDGNTYSAKGQLEGLLFKGYYCEDLNDWYKESDSKNANYEPIILLPNYTALGFGISAFRIDKKCLDFSIDSLNSAIGTVSERWAYMPYATEERITNGLYLSAQFSLDFSNETLAALKQLIYNNVMESNYVLAEPGEGYNPFSAGYSMQSQFMYNAGNHEKYYGYNALYIYQAGYLIQTQEGGPECYSSFETILTNLIESGLFKEYYNELDEGANGEHVNDPIWESNDAPIIYITPGMVDVMMSFPEADQSFKEQKLGTVLGALKFYNKLLEQESEVQKLSELESEIAIDLINRLSDDYAIELGNCLLKMLNAETKLEILSRCFEYGGWSDDKEELIVRVMENTTEAQFEQMWPALTSENCMFTNALMDDLWFSHYDRFMNHLSWHTANLQKKQPSYDFASLPMVTLYHDSMLPGSETETVINGCTVSFDPQLFGIDFDGIDFNLKAWDMVRFKMGSDFKFPGYNGMVLTEGDVLVAPAIWGYYFLSEDAQHTNTELFTYAAAAFIILATEGAGAPVAIELVALGASFTAHVALEMDPLNEELQEFVFYFDLMTMATLAKGPILASYGLSKMPWLVKSSQNIGALFNFTVSELSSYIKMVRNEVGLIDDAIKGADELVDLLLISNLSRGAKDQFIGFLTMASVQFEIAKYGSAFSKARLAVSSGKIQVELYEPAGAFKIGDAFDIGIHGIKSDGSVYLFSPNMFDEAMHGPSSEVLMQIENIAVKEGDDFVTRSYDVVMTTNGQVYLRLIDNVSATTFNISAIKSLPEVLPTGKHLTNLKFSHFSEGFNEAYIVSLGQKYADDLIQIKQGLDKGGNLTEGIVSQSLRDQGYTVIDDLGKYGSNNGYDVVAFKGTIDNPTEILIVEGKQFKQGKIAEFDDIATSSGYDSPSGLTLNPDNPNTGLPTQMSDPWVFNHVFDKMLDGSTNQVKLATAMTDQSIVSKFVFAIDKSTGGGYFTKLGSFN